MLYGPQSSGAGHPHPLFSARWFVGDQRASPSLLVVLEQRQWRGGDLPQGPSEPGVQRTSGGRTNTNVTIDWLTDHNTSTTVHVWTLSRGTALTKWSDGSQFQRVNRHRVGSVTSSYAWSCYTSITGTDVTNVTKDNKRL